MKTVIDGTGGGDPGNVIGKREADALVTENPGWEAEAAFRHHDHPMAEDTEQSANQSIPEPLEAVNEPQLHFETRGWREPTDQQPS